jgi:NAD(P)-dependent dehydrogenase (short-subunit alcohol dehydrogenase family)
MNLISRVYFITGASSGFGAALARAVLERGDQAVLAARRLDSLERIAGPHGARALPLRLDVIDPRSREEAVVAALEHFGRIDVLANIAGQGSLGAAEEFSDEQLREQMELNFFAATALTKAVLPTMRSQAAGHILNLTSIGGLVSVGGFSAYCASKFALEGWSEALRDEVGPLGIKVTIIEPGAFRTEFAGSKNMRPQQRIDAYRPVIEPIEAYLYGGDGKQPGDPSKAAEAMIRIVEHPDPPLRLILGEDALDLAQKKLVAVQQDIAEWKDVGQSTNFEGAETEAIPA